MDFLGFVIFPGRGLRSLETTTVRITPLSTADTEGPVSPVLRSLDLRCLRIKNEVGLAGKLRKHCPYP